jgi:hypothetical protein
MVKVIKNDTQSQATSLPSCRAGVARAREIVRTWGLPESQFDSRCIEVVCVVAVEALNLSSVPKPEDRIMDMKSGPVMIPPGRAE